MIDLAPLQSQHYSRNRARQHTGDAYPCVVCGLPVKSEHRIMVRLHGGGAILVTAEEAEGLDPAADLGGYPIGDDCAHQHPELEPYLARPMWKGTKPTLSKAARDTILALAEDEALRLAALRNGEQGDEWRAYLHKPGFGVHASDSRTVPIAVHSKLVKEGYIARAEESQVTGGSSQPPLIHSDYKLTAKGRSAALAIEAGPDVEEA